MLGILRQDTHHALVILVIDETRKVVYHRGDRCLSACYVDVSSGMSEPFDRSLRLLLGDHVKETYSLVHLRLTEMLRSSDLTPYFAVLP